MRRWIATITIAVVLCLSVGGHAHAAKRIAFVVGNNDYAALPVLQKAVNDAKAVGAALKEIGFTVIPGENLSRRQMNRGLAKLMRAIDPGDQVFFFFAGHGVSLGAENYLLPADMPKPGTGEESLVRDEGYAVSALVNRVRARGATSTFFVLDACRDNPFATVGVRSIGGTRGFTRIEAPRGVFMLFSAGIGQSALDRLPIPGGDPHPNSVFTRKLVPLLKTPGMTHVRLAKEVQGQVDALARTVGHQQQPAYYDQIIGSLILRPGAPKPVEAVKKKQPTATPDNNSEIAALKQQLEALRKRLDQKPRPEAKPEPAPAVRLPESTPSSAPIEDKETIREAQSLLAAAGYDPGPADGLIGSKTRIAIVDFQVRNGLAADGNVSQRLLQSLKREVGEKTSAPKKEKVAVGTFGQTPQRHSQATSDAVNKALRSISFRGKTVRETRRGGRLNCIVNQGLPGFSQPDARGRWTGIDADFCRAMAAALLGSADKVKFQPATAKTRFTMLMSQEGDVLSRNTTWTFNRDVTLGLSFVGANYYDGQGFMVRKALAVRSAKELDGAAACIQPGTTTELNLADYFRANGMSYTPVSADTYSDLRKAYFGGRCDVISMDAMALAAMRSQSGKPDDHVILPEIISREPLSPSVRHGDQDFAFLAKWVRAAMIKAEELGVTSRNVADKARSGNAAVKRLLSPKWVRAVIEQVGNYGEVFDRNLGRGSSLGIARGLNTPWTKGGILYAPSFAGAELPSASRANSGGNVLSRVKSRGQLRCGTVIPRTGQASQARRSPAYRFDEAICKAVAVAVLGRSSMRMQPFGSTREAIEHLQSGKIDLIAGSVEQSMLLESRARVAFPVATVFDGIGIMVRRGLNVASAKGLSGASICLHPGSRTAQSLEDYFAADGMTFKAMEASSLSDAMRRYGRASCDAIAADALHLAQFRSSTASPAEHVILPERLSLQTKGPVATMGDDGWLDIVRWVVNALITAEQFGITAANAEDMKQSSYNPEVKRLLGAGRDLVGKELGLRKDAMLRAVKLVGNYGEIYDKSLGPASAGGLERGPNALWTRGGLLYSPPIR